jgi:histidine transport system substrate-binding protein
MKKLALFLAVAALASSAYAKDWSVIRLGTDASYPPFESKNASGQLVGFDVDLANELCKRMNVKCVWVPTEFDSMIPALKAKKFDAVMSAYSITPAREAQIAFSERLYSTPTRLVARKGSPLQPTVDSLKGKTIGVEQGSIQETFAKAEWAPKGVNVVSYADQDQVYADLISGRLDAALQDAVQADVGFLKASRGAGFAFAGAPLTSTEAAGNGVGIGLRKEDADLKAKLDNAFNDLVKDGTFKKLEAKYFDYDLRG